MPAQEEGMKRGKLAALLVALIAAAILVSAMHGYRRRYAAADYSVYSAWAAMLRGGGDPWRPIGKTASPCNYTPFFCVPFSLLRFGEPASYWLWQAIQVGSLILAVWLLMREIAPASGMAAHIIAVSAAFLFPQVYASLYEAQPTMLLLLLVIAAWVLSRRQWPASAGLMLACATLLKIYPGLVGAYFLFRRATDQGDRRREHLRVLIWSVVWFAAGIVLTNPKYWSEFIRYGVPRFADDALLRQERQVGIWAFTYAIAAHFPLAIYAARLATGAAIAGAVAVAACAIACSLSVPSDAVGEALCVTLWLIAALLLSPLSWAHEAVFVLPLFYCAAVRIGNGHVVSPRTLVMLALALALLTVPFFWVPLRQMHAYFIGVVLSYISACMLILSQPGRSAGDAIGGLRQRRAPAVSI